MTWTTWGESIVKLKPMLALITIAVVLVLFYALDIVLDYIQYRREEAESEDEEQCDA